MRKNHKRNRLQLSVLAAIIGILPLTAGAAGLGKLTVLSGLGQPLRAELEIAASRDEVASLTARVASVETFRQANIDYATILGGVRFTLEKRTGGQPYFKIATDRPVNDPFLDFLVELNWSSGRLIREYTFLLDPPEAKPAEQGASSVAGLPEVKPAAREEQPEAVGQGLASESKPARAAVSTATVSGAAPTEQRTVKRGDTLGRIAAELQPAGVSLDQMLVAMFKANPGAFDGNNMNRLRAGKVLTIPDAAAIAETSASEAHHIVTAHAADFDTYRKRLASAAAAAPAVAEAPTREQSGKLAPKVAEPQSGPGGSDKLQVSRTESGRATGSKSKVAEEDLVAREKALKEANSRIADLEKNLADLKKLAELKSKAAAKPAEQAPAVAKGPEVKAEPPVPVPPKPAEAAAPAKPARKAPPPPPPPPSFWEENGSLVIGSGGGLLALLAGYFGFTAWRRKRDAESENSFGLSEPGLGENSVFSVAQHIDTASTPVGTDTATRDAVDPLQEADVYLAYGRDSQAEEILLDALKATPDRLAIHSKLLEIYAARKSIPQFVTVSQDLQQQTGGAGPEWDRAVALGRVIDPANPLFGGAAPVLDTVDTVVLEAPLPSTEPPTAVQPAAVAELAAPEAGIPESVAEVPSTLDFDLDLGATADASPETSAAAEAEGSVLEFDLDLGVSPAAVEPTPAAAEAPVESDASNSLDIDFDLPDLGTAPAVAEVAPTPAVTEVEAGNSVDFDLGDLAATAEPAAVAAPAAEVDKPLDLDFDLGEPIAAPAAEPVAAPLDLSSISLDLDPLPGGGQPAAEDNPDVATKLELAQAYQEMGDKEGARELLQEVLKEGSPAQQEAARSKLAELA